MKTMIMRALNKLKIKAQIKSRIIKRSKTLLAFVLGFYVYLYIIAENVPQV